MAEAEEYVKFINVKKAKLVAEQEKLQEELDAVERENQKWEQVLKDRDHELRIWRQKLYTSREDYLKAQGKLKNVEAYHEKLASELGEEQFKLNETRQFMVKLKGVKSKQEKLQKEHLEDILSHEGDVLEDDPMLGKLKNELEALKNTKKRLDDKEPLAMEILSGRAMEVVEGQLSSVEVSLNVKRNEVAGKEAELNKMQTKLEEQYRKISEKQSECCGEISALECSVEALDVQQSLKRSYSLVDEYVIPDEDDLVFGMMSLPEDY